MRRHVSNHEVLVESGKGPSKGSHLSAAPGLASQPFHGVVPITLLTPSLFPKWVPGPFGCITATSILDGHNVSMPGQKLRSSNTDHDGLMFSVRRPFQQNRVDSRLHRKI